MRQPLLLLFGNQPNSFQPVKDHLGSHLDHFLQRDLLAFRLPLAENNAQADGKVSDDKAAFKRPVFGKMIILFKQLIPDQIRRTFLLRKITFTGKDKLVCGIQSGHDLKTFPDNELSASSGKLVSSIILKVGSMISS